MGGRAVIGRDDRAVALCAAGPPRAAVSAAPPHTASFRRDTVVVAARVRVRAFDLRGNGRGG